MNDSVYSTFMSTVTRANSQASYVRFRREDHSKESRSGSMNSDILESYSSVLPNCPFDV